MSIVYIDFVFHASYTDLTMKLILDERNESIKKYYDKYGNMAQAGRFFNLTRERIRQILNAQGIVIHRYPHKKPVKGIDIINRRITLEE